MTDEQRADAAVCRTPRSPSYSSSCSGPLADPRACRPKRLCGFHGRLFEERPLTPPPSTYLRDPAAFRSAARFSYVHVTQRGELSGRGYGTRSPGRSTAKCCSCDPLCPATPAAKGTALTQTGFQNRSSLVLQPDDLLLLWLIFTSFLSPSLTPGRKEAEARGFASWWVAVLCGACKKREKKGERFLANLGRESQEPT